MHDVANRLTSLHNQLNPYVYLTENLDELRTNVDQIKVDKKHTIVERFYHWPLYFFIKTLHSGVENEKKIIDDLVKRAANVNPQLASLSQDLEEKRIEVRNHFYSTL